MDNRKIAEKLNPWVQMKDTISEYAYYTAHNIRHPLSNLIFLSDLIKEHDDDKKEELKYMTSSKLKR
ncbi:MAG: hypothetical protein GY816_09180 [Cytophagales bacterium]|nr:hypothetical protein [Cytophagales bacterium]